VPHRLYPDVARRARHSCDYCRAPKAVFNLELELEHTVARARGGADDLANLALACRSCNLRKGATDRARDLQSGELVLLFIPRRDGWAAHFELDLETFRIEGLTPVGRATARRLGMNRPLAVRARRAWVTRLLLRF
jgi:hypothetical protein